MTQCAVSRCKGQHPFRLSRHKHMVSLKADSRPGTCVCVWQHMFSEQDFQEEVCSCAQLAEVHPPRSRHSSTKLWHAWPRSGSERRLSFRYYLLLYWETKHEILAWSVSYAWVRDPYWRESWQNTGTNSIHSVSHICHRARCYTDLVNNMPEVYNKIQIKMKC